MAQQHRRERRSQQEPRGNAACRVERPDHGRNASGANASQPAVARRWTKSQARRHLAAPAPADRRHVSECGSGDRDPDGWTQSSRSRSIHAARTRRPRMTWHWVRKNGSGTLCQFAASKSTARPKDSRTAKSASIGVSYIIVRARNRGAIKEDRPAPWAGSAGRQAREAGPGRVLAGSGLEAENQ